MDSSELEWKWRWINPRINGLDNRGSHSVSLDYAWPDKSWSWPYRSPYMFWLSIDSFRYAAKGLADLSLLVLTMQFLALKTTVEKSTKVRVGYALSLHMYFGDVLYSRVIHLAFHMLLFLVFSFIFVPQWQLWCSIEGDSCMQSRTEYGYFLYVSTGVAIKWHCRCGWEQKRRRLIRRGE